MKPELLNKPDLNLEHLIVHRMILIGMIASIITGAIDWATSDQIGLGNFIDLAISSILIIAFYLQHTGRWLVAIAIPIIALTIFLAVELFAVQFHRPGSIAVFLLLSMVISLIFPRRIGLIIHSFTGLAFAVALIYLGLYGKPFPDNSNLLSTSFSLIIMYTLVAACMAIVKSKYNSLINNVTDQNLKLQQAHSLIENQQEELNLSNESLSDLNVRLEQLVDQKSEKIAIQNKVLYSHAHDLAHVIRAPLARILGLVQLNDIDHEMNADFLLKKITHEAKALDDVVSEVNDKLNNTEYSQVK